MIAIRDYRVEVIYTTKRNTVLIGMTLGAKTPGSAIDIGLSKVIKGYLARQLNSASVTPWGETEGRAVMSKTTQSEKETMTARKKAASEVATVSDPEIISIKGFNLDWTCREFQFEIGKTYEHEGEVAACESGFHAVEYPLDVFGYYPPGTSRYAEVRQSGKIARHSEDTKIASARLSVSLGLSIPDIVTRAIAWITERATEKGEHVTDYQSAASSTGDRSAASSTGDRSAASSTGDRSAASSAGDRSAASSTGDQSAASSTGDQSAASSTGYRSAASSTGYRSAASSTGYRSAASSTGYQSAASSTGYQSAASSTGYRSAAMSSGLEGRAMGVEGNAIFLVYRDPSDWSIKHAWAGVVGQNDIKPLVWYTLNADGAPIECAP